MEKLKAYTQIWLPAQGNPTLKVTGYVNDQYLHHEWSFHVETENGTRSAEGSRRISKEEWKKAQPSSTPMSEAQLLEEFIDIGCKTAYDRLDEIMNVQKAEKPLVVLDHILPKFIDWVEANTRHYMLLATIRNYRSANEQ